MINKIKLSHPEEGGLVAGMSRDGKELYTTTEDTHALILGGDQQRKIQGHRASRNLLYGPGGHQGPEHCTMLAPEDKTERIWLDGQRSVVTMAILTVVDNMDHVVQINRNDPLSRRPMDEGRSDLLLW